MNCLHCGKPVKEFYVEPTVASRGGWLVRCSDPFCVVVGHAFRRDEYADIDISIYAEYSLAYSERLRLGWVTPRFQAARQALTLYCEQRSRKRAGDKSEKKTTDN